MHGRLEFSFPCHAFPERKIWTLTFTLQDESAFLKETRVHLFTNTDFLLDDFATNIEIDVSQTFLDPEDR